MNNKYSKIVLAFVGMVISFTGQAQTQVSSIINANQTWNAAGSPYMVSANTLIEEGVTVNILPGTVVESPSDKIRIIVDGALIAIGKNDSAIVFDKVIFDFTKKSVGYDTATKNGSQFQYCFFNGTGSSAGVKTISLNETGMYISNCKFIDGYYYIYNYSNYDSAALIVEKSIFKGITTNYGYPVYLSSAVSPLYFTDNYVENMGGMFLGKYNTIERCTFRKFNNSSGIRLSSNYRYVRLNCNLFQNFKYYMMDLSYSALGSTVDIQYNTFDSSETLLEFSVGSYYKPAVLIVKRNNFLNYRKNSVVIKGGTSPGMADTLDFRENFWGTGSASTIADGIKDFADDITIGGLVDFSNRVTTQLLTCTGGGNIGDADTSFSQGGSSVVLNMYDNQMNIFPNPAGAMVYVEVPNKVVKHILIFDLAGKMVCQNNNNEIGAQVDVSMLKDGAYVIEVQCDGISLRKKFMVAH